MREFDDRINDTFTSLLVDKWGVGDISGCPWPAASEFNRAASFLFAYRYDLDKYDEARYNDILHEKQHLSDQALEAFCGWLGKQGIHHFPVPGGQDQSSLKAVFSHKYAATRAGLGWIGKNSLLVTPEWGPKVLLRTVLFRADLKAAEPADESRCGDCRACVDACPVSCIKGAPWSPGTPRGSLLDVFACNSFRLGRTPELGHKDACGFCLLACPVGAGAG